MMIDMLCYGEECGSIDYWWLMMSDQGKEEQEESSKQPASLSSNILICNEDV